MSQHTDLSSGRWNSFTLAAQLGNIGSEVDRAIRAWDAGNVARFNGALDRALELFDLTIVDDRWRGHRRREILRAREEFCRLFFDDSVSDDSAHALSAYFLHFALLDRRRTTVIRETVFPACVRDS